VSETKILIYSLREQDLKKLEPGKEKEVLFLEKHSYTIDHAQYEKIWDVNFISDIDNNVKENMRVKDDHSFRCMIACKVNSILSIKIFDIN